MTCKQWPLKAVPEEAVVAEVVVVRAEDAVLAEAVPVEAVGEDAPEAVAGEEAVVVVEAVLEAVVKAPPMRWHPPHRKE